MPRALDSRALEASPAAALRTAAGGGSALTAAHVLALQRTAGNQVVMRLIQARRSPPGGEVAAQVHRAARSGIAGPGRALPHLDAVQQAFGRHDVTGVVAHTGPEATAGAQAMGAAAFAMGNHVAFAGRADLHTAAHEAAHVVQQRAGVQLVGGVGQVGDRYERHADEVAGLVVQGRPAEAVLDRYAARPPGAPPGVQRVILGGETQTKFATLGAILNGLSDIGLVEADDHLNLEIKFADLPEGTGGLTSVWVDGKSINPHVEITPELAPKTDYTILIELNSKTFRDGTSPFKTGQLYETIIHEWELHGRQHALNIAHARSGGQPGARIDHVNLFHPGSTDIDRQIANRINQEEDPRIKQQIFNAYMTDVFAHIYHLQFDYLVANKQTGTFTPVDKLIEYLASLVASLKLWRSLIESLHETDPLRVAATGLAQLGAQHPEDYAVPKVYQEPTGLPIYPRTAAWIEAVHLVLAAPLPADNEVVQVGFGSLHASLRSALVYLHELDDIKAVPAAAQLRLNKPDDKEAWKKAVLAPRIRHLASLGVDVGPLNQNLDLRETGAKPEAHHRTPVELTDEVALVAPPAQASSQPSARAPVSPDEAGYAKNLQAGHVGLYHEGSVLSDFPPDTARQILAGAPGPFVNKQGQRITFLARAVADSFYFDSPYLHSAHGSFDEDESVYVSRLHRGELGIYHQGSILSEFPLGIAKQILRGVHGPFVNRQGQEILFLHRTASGEAFYFDAPYLH